MLAARAQAVSPKVGHAASDSAERTLIGSERRLGEPEATGFSDRHASFAWHGRDQLARERAALRLQREQARSHASQRLGWFRSAAITVASCRGARPGIARPRSGASRQLRAPGNLRAGTDPWSTFRLRAPEPGRCGRGARAGGRWRPRMPSLCPCHAGGRGFKSRPPR
jgi:hypothetical protein